MYNVLISAVWQNDSIICICAFFFLNSFPLWFVTGYYFPVLYSWALLLLHSIYSSLQLLTPASYSIPPPAPALATTSLFSRSMSLFLKQAYSWFIQHPELVENSMSHSINMLVSFWSLSLPAGMLKWSFCLTIASYYEEPAHTCLPAEWVQNNSV